MRQTMDVMTERREDDDDLVVEEEAARRLGVSRGYLRQLRMNGRTRKYPSIPFVRIGSRSIRYRKGDLRTFIERSRVIR